MILVPFYSQSQIVATFPYTESFEAGIGVWTQNLVDDNIDWTLISGSTGSVNTGPDVASDGTFYFYTEASVPNENKTAFLEASFDLSTLVTPYLLFDYHMYGGDMGTLSIDVHDGTSWTTGVWSLVGQQHISNSDPWKLAEVDLTAYVGLSNVLIRLNGLTGPSFNSDIAIDNIEVKHLIIPPFVSNPISDKNLDEGFVSMTIDLANVFMDPNGDPLSYNVSSSNSLVATASVSGSILTITEVGYGYSDILVFADDGLLGIVQDDFVINVNRAGNNAPAISNPISDIFENECFGSTTLDLTNVYTDPEGDPLVYSATSSDPGALSVSVSGNLLTITESGPGQSNITIIVRDGQGATVSNSFEVSINSTPVLAFIGNQSVNEMMELNFTASATDSDSPLSSLTYSIDPSSVSLGMFIESSIGLFSWIPTTAQIGSHMVTVSVTDGAVSDSETFSIEVLDAPSNDFCSDAITLACGTVTAGSTINASTDQNIASNCGSNQVDDGGYGVWYHFVGTGETINLSTCNDANYDTGIGVYTGSCSNGLTCVAGNDDGAVCGVSSQLEFNSLLSEDYYILVDGYGDDRGDFNLTVTCSPTVPPPANNNCIDAEPLTVFAEFTGTPTNGSNVDATEYSGRLSCNPFSNVYDVWYKFNSGANTQVMITNALGTAGNLGLVVHENDCAGSIIYCDPDRSNISTLIDVDPSTDYVFQLYNSSGEGTFTVIVNDGPNTGAMLGSPIASISRYSLDGDLIATIGTSDAEGHAQLLEIVSGNSEGIFEIDASSGEITVADQTVLLATSTTSFVLTIQSNDQGPGAVTSTTTVSINIIDNAYPVIAAESTTIDENSANATALITVTASDADGDNLSYAIVAGNGNNAFAIDASGVITVNDVNELNYELNPIFDLEVRVTDDSPLNLSSSALISVSLNNLNESPIVSSGSVNMGMFDSNGFSLGYVDFNDQDASQIHLYAITNGNTDNIFGIDTSSGELTLINDVNLSANGIATYVLTIEVTDDGTPVKSGVANFTVNVFGNHAPVVTVSSFDLNENSTDGTSVGTVTATDADGNSMAFSISSGNELGALSISSGGDIQVSEATALDFEDNPVIDLVIEAEDDGSGNLSGFAAVTINLLDVNEGPAMANLTFDVSSLSPDGYVIGNANATDPENDVLSYSISSGNSSGIFNIDAGTGEISIASGSLLNPVLTPRHLLIVKAADADFTATATVTINVYGNEFPVLTVSAFNVDENSPTSTLIAILASNDTDGIILFEIIAGNDNNQFAINALTGELSVNTSSEFDHETNQQFDITVQLTDGGLGNLRNSEVVTILINDLNDAPVLASIGDQSGGELSALTFTASATDVDVPANTLSYSLDATSIASGMTIDATTGVFSWTPTEDQDGIHTATITVSDGVLADNEIISLTINEVNVVPVLTALGDQSGDEMVGLLFTASATDVDIPANTLSFSLDASAVASGMSIDAATGAFSWIPASDQCGLHSVTVTVSDGSLVDSETITITVIDKTNPIITSTHGDQTLDSNDNCEVLLPDFTGDVSATDNYDVNLDVTQSPVVGSTLSGAVNFITLSVTDDNGNSESVSFNMAVVDNTVPEIPCTEQTAIINVDETKYTVLAAELDPTSISDNCGVASIVNDFNGTSSLSGEDLPIGITTVLWTVTDEAGNIATCSADITVSITTGLSDLTLAEISIYPNPTIDILNIEVSQKDIQFIRVSDLSGRMLIEQKVYQQRAAIDLTDFTKGIYLISIQSGDAWFSKKIEKK